MVNEFWINLPVKNLEKSKEFFTHMGFKFKSGPGNTDHSAAMLIGGKNVIVMLFSETVFLQFTGNAISDTSKGTEVLFSIDAETREEVDELAVKAEEAGGFVYGKPTESQGWMYGCGFTDPDGHRWGILYMDMSKMGK